MSARAVLVVAALLAASSARGDPRIVLRMASIAPEGTSYARVLHATARNIENESHGAITIKWFLGSIAGDEIEVAERLRKGQLDGAASGGVLCERLAPSMRVTQLPGLFQDRVEAAYAHNALRPLFAEEMQRSGVTLLTTFGLGPAVIFLRSPIHSFEELRAAKVWEWDRYELVVRVEEAMGLHLVPMPIEAASHAYDERRTDGFIGIPSAALAFQWTSQVHFFVDLRMRYLSGCVVISNRALDRMGLDDRQIVLAEFAKVGVRYEELARQQDEQLLSELFQRQGLKAIQVSAALRADFLSAAQRARQQLVDHGVAQSLFDRVASIIAAYRSAHSNQ